MKYCLNCRKTVEPKKHLNWIALILFGLFYVIYYIAMSGRCPMCNSQNWGVKHATN